MSHINRPYHGLSHFGGPFQGMSHFNAPYHGLSHFGGPYHGMSLFHGRHTGFEYDWLRDDLIELCQKAKEEGQSMPSAARSLLIMNISALKVAGDWRPGPRRRNIIDGRLVSYLS